MPLYKVTQKQGSKTFTTHLEAKNLSCLLNFLKSVSTAKVSAVYEVLYEDEDTSIPVDDFNYLSQFKAIISNKEGRICKQVLIHHIKPSVSQNEMYNLIMQNLEVGNLKVDSVACKLFKH